MSFVFVVQPNGNFAIFSTVVDNFTHINLSEQEVIDLAIVQYHCPLAIVQDKISKAKKRSVEMLDEWNAYLLAIAILHGEGVKDRLIRCINSGHKGGQYA